MTASVSQPFSIDKNSDEASSSSPSSFSSSSSSYILTSLLRILFCGLYFSYYIEVLEVISWKDNVSQLSFHPTQSLTSPSRIPMLITSYMIFVILFLSLNHSRACSFHLHTSCLSFFMLTGLSSVKLDIL